MDPFHHFIDSRLSIEKTKRDMFVFNRSPALFAYHKNRETFLNKKESKEEIRATAGLAQ